MLGRDIVNDSKLDMGNIARQPNRDSTSYVGGNALSGPLSWVCEGPCELRMSGVQLGQPLKCMHVWPRYTPMHIVASHMGRVISLCSQIMGYAYVVNVYTYAY